MSKPKTTKMDYYKLKEYLNHNLMFNTKYMGISYIDGYKIKTVTSRNDTFIGGNKLTEIKMHFRVFDGSDELNFIMTSQHNWDKEFFLSHGTIYDLIFSHMIEVWKPEIERIFKEKFQRKQFEINLINTWVWSEGRDYKTRSEIEQKILNEDYTLIVVSKQLKTI